MRVVVTGASGNVGTSLLRALEGEAAVTSVLGLARRGDTPPLDPQAGGPLRLGEFRTGVGGSA